MAPSIRHQSKQAKRQALSTKRILPTPETHGRKVTAARQHNATKSPLASLPEELILAILRRLGRYDLTTLYCLRRVSSVFFRLINNEPDILLQRNLGVGTIIPWFDGIWDYEVVKREIKVLLCAGPTYIETLQWTLGEEVDEKGDVWQMNTGYKRDTVCFRRTSRALWHPPLTLSPRNKEGTTATKGPTQDEDETDMDNPSTDFRSVHILNTDRYEKAYPFWGEKDELYMGYRRRNQAIFRELKGKVFP